MLNDTHPVWEWPAPEAFSQERVQVLVLEPGRASSETVQVDPGIQFRPPVRGI